MSDATSHLRPGTDRPRRRRPDRHLARHAPGPARAGRAAGRGRRSTPGRPPPGGGARRGRRRSAGLFADPDVEAVVITAASAAHADLIVAAAEAGKAVFCEKPMGLTWRGRPRDRGGRGSRRGAAGGLQPTVRARLRGGAPAVVAGGVGTPQLMRSLTRDPGLADPAGVPPWTIFLQTLIHDFDTLLWLNPGAGPVERLRDGRRAGRAGVQGCRPARHRCGRHHVRQRRDRHRRGQLLGRVRVRRPGRGVRLAGMVTVGDGARSALRAPTTAGRHVETVRGDIELFRDAYTGEFVEFVAAVREGRARGHRRGRAPRARPGAGRIESVKAGGPVPVAEDRRPMSGELRLHAGGLRGDGLPRSARRERVSASTTPGSRSRSGTGPPRTSTPWPLPVRGSRP